MEKKELSLRCSTPRTRHYKVINEHIFMFACKRVYRKDIRLSNPIGCSLSLTVSVLGGTGGDSLSPFNNSNFVQCQEPTKLGLSRIIVHLILRPATRKLLLPLLWYFLPLLIHYCLFYPLRCVATCSITGKEVSMKTKSVNIPFGSWENYAKYLSVENRSEIRLKESYFSFIIDKGLFDEYRAYCRQKEEARSASRKNMRSALRKAIDEIYKL